MVIGYSRRNSFETNLYANKATRGAISFVDKAP